MPTVEISFPEIKKCCRVSCERVYCMVESLLSNCKNENRPKKHT